MKSISFDGIEYTRQNPLAGVYKITCTGNNKEYIGSSSNIIQIFQNHIRLLKAQTHANPILINCYNKYGRDSLKLGVVCISPVNEDGTINRDGLYRLEKVYIDICKPVLNISQETLAPPRIVTKVQKYSLEGNFIEEYESVTDAAAVIGFAPPNIFAVLKGIKKKAGGFLWKSFEGRYPATIEPLTLDLNTTQGLNDFWRTEAYTIYKKDAITKEVVETFTNFDEFVNHLGLCRSHVMNCLGGKSISKTCGGFIVECPEYLAIQQISKRGAPRITQKLNDSGEVLESFPSTAAAAKSLGVDKSAVSHAIKGGNKSKGYFWRYAPSEV